MQSNRRVQVQASAWTDQDEVRRWTKLAEQVSERLRDERGVEESVLVVADYGALWVEYGLLRIRVAGPNAEVQSEQALFDDIDSSVAFDREEGPGRVLDRDRAVIADVRAQMPVGVALWSRAAERVMADLRATTDLNWTCQVVVREDEPTPMAVPRGSRDAGAGVSAVVVDVGPIESLADLYSQQHLAHRALALPQLLLDCDEGGWATTVDEYQDDVEAACLEVVEQVAAAIDDWSHAWPVCPQHREVVEAELVDGQARWVCARGDLDVAVGSLWARNPERG